MPRAPDGCRRHGRFWLPSDPASGMPFFMPFFPGHLSSKATLAAGILAAVLSWWIGEAVFHQLPVTADERSYLFQAHHFAEGRLKDPAPAYASSFQYPMIILDPEAGWFSRYPPGHAGWLTLGLWIGSLYGMIALGAGLTVMLAIWSARAIGASAVAVGLAFLLSPFFLFTHGTLMSHTSGILAASGMLAAYIRWRHTDRIRWAILSGLAWAWMLNNRTYTAALIALPFAADALWMLWMSRRSRRAWLGTAGFAGAALVGVGVLLGYNDLTLGDPLAMTYLYYDPSDKLGFGWRHNHPVFPAPLPVFHTPERALENLAGKLRLLDHRLFGFPGGLWVWLALTIYGWSRRWSPLLLGSALAVWFGYMLFWYPGFNDTGPVYFMEVMPAMVLAAGLGANRLIRRLPRTRVMYGGAVALAALWLGVSAHFIVTEGRALRSGREALAETVEAIRNAPPQSLVFVRPDAESPWWKHDLIENPEGLEGTVVVARWHDATKDAVMRHFRHLTPRLLRLDADGPRLEPIDPAPLDKRFRIATLHRHTGTNRHHPDNGRRLIRTAREAEHDAGTLLFGRSVEGYPGNFIAEFELSIEGLDHADTALTLDVAAGAGENILAEKTVRGSLARTRKQIPFRLDENTLVEPRASYHGNGNVTIYSVRIYEDTATTRCDG